MEELYRLNITIESKDQFEDKVKGWTRSDRYVGADKQDRMCMLYFHDYETFIGGKNEEEVKRFCKSEVNKVKKKGYSVEGVHFTIEKVKEAQGRKISVRSLESQVKD